MGFFLHTGVSFVICYSHSQVPMSCRGAEGAARDRARAAGTGEAKGRSQQPALGWDGFALSRVWGGKEGKSKSVFIDIKIQR